MHLRAHTLEHNPIILKNNRTQPHLHGQLSGHHTRDYNNTLQQQLVRGFLLFAQTLLQHVARGEDGEHEEQQQSQAGLLGVACLVCSAVWCSVGVSTVQCSVVHGCCVV